MSWTLKEELNNWFGFKYNFPRRIWIFFLVQVSYDWNILNKKNLLWNWCTNWNDINKIKFTTDQFFLHYGGEWRLVYYHSSLKWIQFHYFNSNIVFISNGGCGTEFWRIGTKAKEFRVFFSVAIFFLSLWGFGFIAHNSLWQAIKVLALKEKISLIYLSWHQLNKKKLSKI